MRILDRVALVAALTLVIPVGATRARAENEGAQHAPAAAPAAAPAPTPKPLGTKRVALDVIRIVVPREAYEAMLDQMTTNMVQTMAQSGARLPPDTSKKLLAAMGDVLAYEELLDWSAEIYARYFTDKELGDLAAFYRTPTGKKAARLLPQLSGEVGKFAGPVLMKRLPEAMRKHGLQ